MFAPETPGHTHSLRPKRNRQTAGNEDTLPTAKRKRRSALRRDTFEPLAEASINEIPEREKSESKANGHIESITSKAPAAKSKDLTYRGPKIERRSDRTQPSSILATNDFYTVSELPSLPQQVRDFDKNSKPYSCAFSVDHGYALSITHSEAVIWPYTSSAPIPSSRDVTIVPLSFLQTSDSDPLPLATFTKSSINNEPGLLVVSAKWGKIIYWDNLTNASTILPGQDSTGVQGTVPNMSGEIVKDLVNAEPAGFILSFSRGRVSHVSVRDQKGRPSIGVQNLNKAPGHGLIGTIGGSVRKIVGWSHRKGSPLVKAGAARKGQRDVVIATENADLELWETNITVGNSSKLQRNILDDLRMALQPHLQAEKTVQQYDLRVLDIELASAGQELARGDEPSAVSLVTLVALSDSNGTQFFLVELSASAEEVMITAANPIRCYSSKVAKTDAWQPRLSIVKSTAFAIFETAVVVFSLSKMNESPSSQLMTEGHTLPAPFQDVIQLDEDKSFRFLGHAVDEDSQNAWCLLAVLMKGVIRIQSHKNDAKVDADSYTSKIDAKNRMEQAIYYGADKENPLNLNTASAISFTQEEVEEAALQVSQEIITADSKHLSKGSTSITKHLQDRAKYLDSLIHYLRKYHHDKCSEEVRDQLLWNAEKVAAAQAIWKAQEVIQRRYPLEDRELSHMEFALRALHESRQKYPDEEKGQTDRVRHWLLNSIEHVQIFLKEIIDCLRELPDWDITDPRVVGELTVEATDIWIAAYTAAFKFREDNAAWYGFEDRLLDNGVFVDGYDILAGRPWTSQPQPNKHAHKLLEYVCNFLDEWWDYTPDAKSKKKKMPVSSDGKEHDAPPRVLVTELAGKLPKEVDLLVRIISEEVTWAANEEAHKQKDPEADTVKEIKAEKQPKIAQSVEKMAEFNMEGAIQIAERLRDPYLLVNLTSVYLRRLNLEAMAHPEVAEKNQKKIAEIQDHAETYYETFGPRWAMANFSRKMENGELGSLLNEAQENEGQKQSYLNQFLKRAKRAGQPVGKIIWINDIRGEGNYHHAERTLNKVAEEEESYVWAKKTELCLAKLAGLAALEEQSASRQPSAVSAVSYKYDNKIALIEIQERITQHILLSIGPTIDDKAAEDLAMSTFSARIVSKSPGLKRLLKKAISSLLTEQPLSPDELIDFLTLADPFNYGEEPESDPEILGKEFTIAHEVIDLADLTTVHKIALRQIVWRRAMIRDDWLQLNNTANKSDQQVQDDMELSSLFKSLLDVTWKATQNDDLAQLGSKIMSPTQLLEDNPFPVVLQEEERFKGAEKEKEAVKKDMEKEQAVLKKYVDKAQLELHWSGLKDGVLELLQRQALEAQEAEAEAEAEAAAIAGNEE